MVEKLETRSAPALAAINAFVRGSSARLCSSNKLGWDGVYLEHHRIFPVERNDSVSPHHLVVLFTSHVARGETSAGARALRPLLLLSRRHETLFCRSDWRMQAIYRHTQRSCAPSTLSWWPKSETIWARLQRWSFDRSRIFVMILCKA